ncbi:DNA alkylation repair protein [Bathymodiolus thermophilus thioautotrophic gill symbiont]|uniref:Probable DNA alkylation repair enzyme n=1 Tax=Bathymodiolus thermophilus thioautotrophic gill symbiont TaxID=2360 RepID=A0A8H9CFC5_9GAMM|nr:DNA alkylation repair protein [Bathymodiolus thermophilus thioautotrophic gill symbiont]CAB5495860.1 probable DNA alkylation repair enzyme [Bathymodiolus thermophilus thioautotrophic gill symbiont]
MEAEIIIKALKSFATPERKKTNEWFFKTGKGEYSEFDKFMGVRMPKVRQVAKQYGNSLAFNEIKILTDHPIHEVRHCGLIILVHHYQIGDCETVFNYYIDNIQAVNNWDLVDTTTPQIVGDYLFKHQEKLPLLLNYTHSPNLWERRIAIIATLAFIRQNEFNITLKIGKLLLNDTQDLIHKAVGWMLREVYKRDPNICKKFLQKNYKQLPRTTLRYAIEHMQKTERLKCLKGNFNVSN